MLKAGPAQKVTIHVNEDTVAQNDFLYNEIFSLLYKRGVAGATLFRPEAGFGAHHRMHKAHQPYPGEKGHLPVRIEFVESTDKVAEVLPDLCSIVTDGLIEVQDTHIYKLAIGQESR